MNIILVGAGGIWISALWLLFKRLWYDNILWVDSSISKVTQWLEHAGIKVYIGHWQYQVQPWDLVIYSDACPQAPEVEQARQHVSESAPWARYPLSYFQFVWEISKFFETISVAWTHGKSTTSAMLTVIMSQSDPKLWLWIVWALVPQLQNTNYRINEKKSEDIKTIFAYILFGKQQWRDESLRKKYRFIIEADEFNKHFLYIDTDYAIILNAELDHSDIYPTQEYYLQIFVEFCYKVKKKIFVLAWEKWVDYLLQHWPDTIHSVSKSVFDLPYLFGDHIQKNASLNNALMQELGIENYSFSEFKGLRRRMELLKVYENWGILYSDYWHHPTEINAVLNAMKEKYPEKKIIAIFQPHQARRVLEFRNDFKNTVSQFDERIIYSLYTARENLDTLLAEFPIPWGATVSSAQELWEIFAQACAWTYITDFKNISERIEAIQSDQVICLFSAWNADFQLREYLGV